MNRAEGDGVAELLRRRDRGLPRAPGLAGQHVARPRFERDLPDASPDALPALEAQAAASAQRNADHRPENRGVAVPADRRPRRVALYEDLDEGFGARAGKVGRAGAHWQQPVRYRLAGL